MGHSRLKYRCGCCGTLVVFPASDSFQCVVCEVITDLRATHRGKQHAPAGIDGPVFRQRLEGGGSVDDQRAAIFEVFADAALINRSFVPRENEHAIDLAALDDFYGYVLSLPNELKKATMESTAHILARPGLPAPNDAGHFRFVVILLLNPLLDKKRTQGQREYHHFVQRMAYGILSNSLALRHKRCLVDGVLASLDTRHMRALVEQANYFLNARISKLRDRSYDDWSVRAACDFMGLLFQANERAGLVDISEFYNTAIDYHINVERDWSKFIRSTSSGFRQAQREHPGEHRSDAKKFCFCLYPFLMSMGLKMKILASDARRQQELRMLQSISLGPDLFFPTDMGSPFLTLDIRREFLVQDSVNQLSAAKSDLKKKIKIRFVGEDGIDAGGLAKEWFLLLTRELFSPKYSIFAIEEESNLLWFSCSSVATAEDCRLVGTVLGLAIYNGVILDVRLPRAVYKKLFHIPLTLSDLYELRPLVAKSLGALLEYEAGDFEGLFALTFSAETSDCGRLRRFDLVKNGSRVGVTLDNKHEYVARYLDFVFNASVAHIFKPFKKGFDEVFSGPSLTLFRPEEIVQLVGGTDEIDTDMLKSVTVYERCADSDEVIRWFWEIVDGWDASMRHRLLAFVTGTDRVPAVEGAHMSFKILVHGDDCDRYPIGRTCFNQLCIYRYSSRSKLRRMLEGAILGCEGFGIK